tara:strand:- start:70 stop:1368 length:1299 start_codon:yes stop_codon:yes gene_type:complete
LSYSQTTQAQLASAILESLNDPTSVFWATDEINRAINEALLTWGAYSSYWRDRGTFSSAAATPFYDLSVQLPSLRARSYTFGDLVTEIQYHLNEYPAGFALTSQTTQFTSSQIISALGRAANEFNLDSKIAFAQTTISGISTPRTAITGTVAAIARASWTDSITSVTRALRREDAWSEDSYNPLWTLQPGLPFAFSSAETPPITVNLFPPPLNSGSLNLIYADTEDYSGAASGTIFPIPNEFVHAVKWRAIYSLLGTQGQGYDPFRAKYCAERYESFTQISSLMRSVIRVQINGVPIPMDTIAAMDAGRPNWQSKQGKPSMAGALYDIIALSDVPKTSTYAITCDLVRSAPLPTTTTDYIQVGYEELQYILDMARHILSFKLGGEEFQTTFALYDNFQAGAQQRSTILGYQARYLSDLFGVPAREENIQNAA